MKKDIPLISHLLRSIIVEDYASAMEVITDDSFNPNETNSSWRAPVITAIVNILSNMPSKKDSKELREVLKTIVKNKDFDPNVLDATGETCLMHIARHEEFNWLVPFIFNTNKVDINIKNQMSKDLLDIAEASENKTLSDIVMSIRILDIKKGQPKKRVGIKKRICLTPIDSPSKGNGNILDKLEKAFEDNQKRNPVSLYALIKAFFQGDYTTCIQIVRDVNFNPNECDRWEEPALSSLIYYSQDVNVNYDESMFKKIVDVIIENKRFDVNALDADCNTTLMVAMSFPRLQWLTEKLFNIQSARLDVLNDSGENLRSIAENCGNGDFYNHLVMKSFEAVEAIK